MLINFFYVLSINNKLKRNLFIKIKILKDIFNHTLNII